ncbi:hypothetical protein GARC_0187 [Paraglaciecola arctica BSs20135]|uniref:Uncharacterized protein n=1 Tax=Paraglaciecola arctica BSs20135 TaxID=493475 RepID=K6X960_9ALTE|nr:hypothetical protein GARC_0187 [Paraglaciecola arctica BSs20135]
MTWEITKWVYLIPPKVYSLLENIAYITFCFRFDIIALIISSPK